MAQSGGDLRVGDLVVCGSRRFREQLGLDLELGMLIAGRRRDGRVYFARSRRSVWIPRRHLAAVEADDARVVAPPAWLVTVHGMMRLLEASDVQLEEEDASGRLEARVGCPGPIDRSIRDRLDALLGPLAASLRVAPGGLARLVVVLPVAPGRALATADVDSDTAKA